MVPSGGGQEVTKVTAAQTADRKFAMLYIPSQGKEPRELTLDLSLFPGPVSGRWINPAKDAQDILWERPLKNAQGQIVRTPGDNSTGTSDWVLILEAQ